MTGKFRGFKVVDEEFKEITGTGVLFINPKAYILKYTVPTSESVTKIQVVPASVSQSIYVENLGHVYLGDVVKYTFKEKNEYYSRYYQIVERNNLVKFMELYRDYVLNEEDLTVTRGKFRTNLGEYRAIDTPMKYTETYTVVGNIWQNPEFGRV